MDTRMFSINRRFARGAASSTVMISILILLAIAAAGWFLVIQPNLEARHSMEAPVVVAKKVASASSAPPPANVAAMTTDQLLSEASKAVKDERLLAPAGNNAFEFYLKVLERQPNNQVAKDALRETFPFGANEAEQDINNRNFNEAQREIDLLARADPENYTLTILRSKLDAQRKTATKEQQQAQAQLLAQQQAAAQRAAAAAAAKNKPADQGQSVAQETPSKPARAKPQAPSAAQGKPETAQAAPKQRSIIQGAVLVKQVAPRYPMSARLRGQQGWVDVQFTVQDDGSVSNVTAIDADPRHVFERSAVDAVERWKFRPALNNGKPFPVTMRKRIVFRLGQG